MALILELPPELEARLAAEAAARSLDLPSYATLVLQTAAPAAVTHRHQTAEDFELSTSAMAERCERVSALDTESFTHESYYGDVI